MFYNYFLTQRNTACYCSEYGMGCLAFLSVLDASEPYLTPCLTHLWCSCWLQDHDTNFVLIYAQELFWATVEVWGRNKPLTMGRECDGALLLSVSPHWQQASVYHSCSNSRMDIWIEYPSIPVIVSVPLTCDLWENLPIKYLCPCPCPRLQLSHWPSMCSCTTMLEKFMWFKVICSNLDHEHVLCKTEWFLYLD